jgi:hypothetical protein
LTDNSPFVEKTKLTVIIKAKNEVWAHIDLVGLDIAATAATPRDSSVVRPNASVKTIAVEKENKNFSFSPDDGIVALRGAWELQPNTTPGITVKMLFSDDALPVESKPEVQVKETVITFPTFNYPPVLQKYRFNVDTGIIVSGIRNPSFVRVQTAAAVGKPGDPGSSPAMYETQTVEGSLSVMPVLLFTVYIPERPIGPKLKPIERIPQPTFGFSLTSPSTDFFFGASSEIVRKVQIVGGVHVGKINALVPVPFDDPTSSAAPAVTTKFAYKGFIGIALNLDFIKTAFGK